MGLLKKLKLPLTQRKFEHLDGEQGRITNAILKAGTLEAALNVGEKLPITALHNCFGENVNLDEIFQRGPLVLKFFLGTWSTACAADLMLTQECQSKYRAFGATTIAVSTQSSEQLGNFANEQELNFHLVSDYRLARAFGLMVKMSDDLIAVYKNLHGIKLAKVHGRALPEVCYPATYVIDRTGFIIYAHLIDDVMVRPDPTEVLRAVRRVNVDREQYFAVCNEEESRTRAYASNLYRRNDKLRTVTQSKKVPKTRSTQSLTEQDAGDEPLRYCLQNEDFAHSFKAYLSKAFCLDALLFYYDACLFRETFREMNEETRRSTTGRIYRVYIRMGSELEVPIKEATREAIVNCYHRNLLHENLFVQASKEVLKVLEEDAFVKWQRTSEFRRLWTKNGQIQALSPFAHVD